MAHPNPKRGGSEKGQRERAGPTSQASDVGMQNRSQGIAGGKDQPMNSGTEAARGTRDTMAEQRGDRSADIRQASRKRRDRSR